MSATDGGGNTASSGEYDMYLTGPPNWSYPSYDNNGNMTSDGTNSYLWDAENRLVEIDYPGTGNSSAFTYDGLGRNVQIVETVGGTVGSTKQFVWSGNEKCEARDASSTIISQYFPYGQTVSGSNYYYTKDHLKSVHELTDSSSNILAEYSYDPYGRVSQITQGSVSSDFQYAGYYYHAPSSLNLTLHRTYSASLARWINRDPIGDPVFGMTPWHGSGNVNASPSVGLPEILSGPNLYAFVKNSPVLNIDPLGLDCDCTTAPPVPSCSPSCSDYGTTTYLGASQQCFCRCAGDSPWADQVRACLLCEYNKGTPTQEAHQKCYSATPGFGRDELFMIFICELQCQQAYMAY